MKPAFSTLALLEPRSLSQALSMMRNEGPLVPIAGCTDVFVNLNFGTERGRRFLNLWRLRELRGISKLSNALRIGALTTYSEMIQSPLVGRHFPMLAAASREIGGAQVQNRGTIGGNIANASPAGDTLPVLSVAEATIVLRSTAEERRVPFLEFYAGYRKTVMRSDELIVAIEIPWLSGRQWFRKVGTRAAQTISKVVVAGLGGTQPRFALGSVGPTVIRARNTEAALSRGASIEEARRALMDEIHPIDDIRSTEEYRRRVAGNLLRRFCNQTCGRS